MEELRIGAWAGRIGWMAMTVPSEQKESVRARLARLVTGVRRQWTAEAGEVFRQGSEGRGWLGARWVEFLLFVRELIRQFLAVEGMGRATSLAFTTLMSLVPLAVFLSTTLRNYFANVLPGTRDHTIDLIGQVLPYRSGDVAEQIRQAAENAEAASAFSAAVFVLIGFNLFVEVESTLNRIWRVGRARKIRQRLLAFSLLMFWGPVLIGLSLTTSVAVQRTSTMRFLLERTAMPAVLPFVVMLAAFTMVFWLVPATRVAFRSAFVGAAFTTILFELIRYGFGTYAVVLFTGRMNVIYGTFGLVIIFLVVLQAAWVVILLGAQMSYVHQHLPGILRASSQRLEERSEHDLYFALRGMLEIARCFAERTPAPSTEQIAERVGATEPQMLNLVSALERAGLVRDAEGDEPGWLPASNPDAMKLIEILRSVEGKEHAVPARVRRSSDEAVVDLVKARSESMPEAFAEMTLSDLLGRVGHREDSVSES